MKNLPSEITIDAKVRGTRILTDNTASIRRKVINQFADACEQFGAKEIVLPSLEMAQIYTDKAGDEILGQMYTFEDSKGRKLCLRPEGTATCQLIAQAYPRTRDISLWYELRCWRSERPQKGRYREFTQLGFEFLNPRDADMDAIIALGYEFIKQLVPTAEISLGAKRGLAYYENGEGWEVIIPELGAQKQVLGGGQYAEGAGFAIGLDRLVLAMAEA